MYCSVCDRVARRGKSPNVHECLKNWIRDSSSTSMESAAITEGFEASIENHKLIYEKLIADGDSNVYTKILEADPYAEYQVEVQKIKCVKHLRRAFRTRVSNIEKSKRGRIGRARKLVLASGQQCVLEIDRVLKHFWDL